MTTPTPQIRSEVFEVPLKLEPEPIPTTEYRAFIPATPEPTVRPEKLHDQMMRCLDFKAERSNATSYSSVSIVVRMTVRNRCDVTFSGSDLWVEALAIPAIGSGVAGREIGRFQQQVPPYGTGETLVQINDITSHDFYRFEARLWWAAGAGRSAGE